MSMEWYGEKIAANVQKQGKAALKRAAEMVLTKSKQQVPVETGALMRSGTRKETNGGYAQELSYNTPYAHIQHEDLGFQHPNGGNAKYLEQPLRENAQQALDMIKLGMAQGLKG